MQSFLQIIFAASICDLILTTLITYYRVFCIRHHSKNTLYLPLSFWHSSNRDDPVLTGTFLSLSICFFSMELRRLRSPMIVSRTFTRAHSCVFVSVCGIVWIECMWTYLDFYPCAAAALIWFKRCCCCWCCCCALIFFFVSEPFRSILLRVLDDDDTCCSTGFGWKEFDFP